MVEFFRKGCETYKQPDFSAGELAAITYITTGKMDRDYEIVKPSGIDLSYYEKHPIVLFGHNYGKLPIGKNIWVKKDESHRGLIAKTVYTSKEANPEGHQIYQYRKEGC